MSAEATVNVYYQPGAAGDRGLRMLRAEARDASGRPLDGAELIFTIVEGPGALGDGDEQIVVLHSDRSGHAFTYWYPILAGADDRAAVRAATIHVRTETPAVDSLELVALA